MPRPKGSKNKPKDVLNGLIYENLPDFLTPEEVAKWRRTSRSKIMKMIYNKEIPEDCYERDGNRYKLKKYKLAFLWEIRGTEQKSA